MSAHARGRDVSKHFGGLHAVKNVSFSLRAGRTHRHPRPQRRRQDHAVQPPDRLHCRATPARSASRDRSFGDWRPTGSSTAASARTFQLTRPFVGMTVLENVVVACLSPRARRGADKEARAHELLDQVGLGAQGRRAGRDVALWRSAAAGNRPCARHQTRSAAARRTLCRPRQQRDRAARAIDQAAAPTRKS